MNHSTSSEYDSLIRPIETVSRIIAIWPGNQERSKFKELLSVFHRVGMICVTVIMTTAVSFDVTRHWSDMNEATECALIASAFALSIVRMLNYTIHSDEMRYVVETMRKDWLESSPEDKAVLAQRCRWTFRLAKHFIVSVGLALGLFMLAPMIDILVFHSEERILPFRGYFMRNQTSSPLYERLYVVNVILGGLCGTTIAGATSFNLVSTMHGAARFSVLQKRLEALKSNDSDCGAAMIDCVKRHQDAIKFADTLERIINVLALGQFVISTALVCCAGFQLASMIEDKSRLMKYFSFLNSAIFELFLFSYSGNQLIDESEAIIDSAYASEWIGGPFCLNLRILMLRATRPSKITAAKFYDMSLKSFSSVLSTSFSYFTVLQTMNEE
ncbi:odorant receptor 13a-like [Venturia canescens]|uniref:odorant receptor 13a-like n=1 Tax=Venturia canescens TaxID=32260 RepID=UPI001C9D300E|nr:odorant receptor 13a-like [Venturia canescens]